MIRNSFQILLSNSNNTLPPLINEATQTFKNSIRSANYKLFNDEMIIDLLEKKFDNDVINAYQKLKPKAYKADLARYCIIYAFGGWYADITIKFLKIINENIQNFEFLGFMDMGDGLRPFTLPYPIQSSLFYANKNSLIMEKAIDIVINNCKKDYYGITSTSPTGPGVLGRALAQYGVNENHIIGHFMPLTPNHTNQNRSYVLPDGTILALHKDAWVAGAKSGQINEFGVDDSDNYLEMYINKDIYN